jgi:hypothetical protein
MCDAGFRGFRDGGAPAKEAEVNFETHSKNFLSMRRQVFEKTKINEFSQHGLTDWQRARRNQVAGQDKASGAAATAR